MGWGVLKPSRSRLSHSFLSGRNDAVCFLMSGYDLLEVTQKMSHLGCPQTSHWAASGPSVASEREALTYPNIFYLVGLAMPFLDFFF